MIDTFTSTGKKLLRHPALLKSWMEGYPVPHSLQVALTERCNLSCRFCSVRNRERKFEWDEHELERATQIFVDLGVKSVEITGGGEPLCYSKLVTYLSYLLDRGLKVGLITNGIGINALGYLFVDWIRISANVYDYTGKIDIPDNFKGTLGFSYVWGLGSSLKSLQEIKKIALANNVEYIRLVKDCTGYEDDEKLEMIADEVGPPVFYQRKDFKAPANCYWGYVKPFLYCDEYVYACSSIVLNPQACKRFHESYRICHWTEIEEFWAEPIHSLVDTTKCSHCVFTKQNEILDYALTPKKHEAFI